MGGNSLTIKYYNSKTKWKKLKKEAIQRGESTIHDDFIDVNGITTDGTSGRLTFDIIPSTLDTELIRKKELNKKLKDDTITFDELKEYLRLKSK